MLCGGISCYSICRYKELTYSESKDHIENPNRGFVMQDSGRASNYEEIYVCHNGY